MSTHTIEDVDLSHLAKKSKDLVRAAVALGWRARNIKGGAVMVVSTYTQGQNITVPTSANINDHRLKGWYDKLKRYSDPMRLAVVQGEVSAGTVPGLPNARMELAYDHDPASPLNSSGDTIPAEYVSEGFSQAKPEPVVLTEVPWMAKRGTGEKNAQLYPSKTVIERKWSDGSTDYACAGADCDFADPVPQRVAAHYRSSKKGHPVVDAPQREEVVRAEPYVPGHSSSEQRIKRLEAELLRAIESVVDIPGYGTASDEDRAHMIATRMIEERDRRREREDHDQQPLTPEEVIDRIRGLVDDGSYLRRIERERELDTRVAELELAAEQCRLRADQAEAERDSIREEWASLAELVGRVPQPKGHSDG